MYFQQKYLNMENLTQEIVDQVKQKPITEQISFLLDCLDTTELSKKNIKYLVQFEQLLTDIKAANKNCSDTDGDFKQNRIDEVVRMNVERGKCSQE